LIDRFKSKLFVSKANHFLFAWRVTLAKYVIEVLMFPTKTLSLPNVVLNEIYRLKTSFIWGTMVMADTCIMWNGTWWLSLSPMQGLVFRDYISHIRCVFSN